MSYTTCEVRWFIPGAIPTNFKTWFNPSQQPEQRTDIYLYAPVNDFVGIKLREGRLEIKWRISELGAVQFTDSVTGKVEKWRKWMCNDSTKEAFLPIQVQNNPTWVNVKKSRYLQSYQIAPGAVPEKLDNNRNLYNVKNSCNVELTLLEIYNKTWWSIALEASGEEANLIDNLCATADYLFTDFKGIELQINDSSAYPYWINSFC